MAKEAVASLLRECRISVEWRDRERGSELEERIRAECAKRDLSSAIHLNAAIETGVDIALHAYAHVGSDVQYFIALYTMLGVTIDNHSVSQQALEAYVACGKTSGEPILEWLAECLGSAHKYFEPYAAGTIVSATTGFLQSEILDMTMEKYSMTCQSLRFAENRRIKSEIGRAHV